MDWILQINLVTIRFRQISFTSLAWINMVFLCNLNWQHLVIVMIVRYVRLVGQSTPQYVDPPDAPWSGAATLSIKVPEEQ